MMELAKANHQLERQAQEAAHQYRRASSAEREEIRKQLGELVNKHFELRQKLRTKELERIQERIEKLRTSIEERNENREAVIERRLKELLGESDGLRF